MRLWRLDTYAGWALPHMREVQAVSVLTREEFDAIMPPTCSITPLSRGEANRLRISDAALRAIIQRAVEDVEKMPHFGICHSRDTSACHNGADRECEWMVARCRTHKPEAFICNCGRDAAIERLKKGLEK